MIRAVGAFENLHAQVPTASGLAALAHCSRRASLVGLGLAPRHLFYDLGENLIGIDVFRFRLEIEDNAMA